MSCLNTIPLLPKKSLKVQLEKIKPFPNNLTAPQNKAKLIYQNTKMLSKL